MSDSNNNFKQSDILRLLCDEQWSNAACCGYLILSCESLNYSHDKVKMLLNAMKDVFEQQTVEQAKLKYCRY